jgi:hypothetical protein
MLSEIKQIQGDIYQCFLSYAKCGHQKMQRGTLEGVEISKGEGEKEGNERSNISKYFI